MSKNQIFKKMPPTELIMGILNSFGLNDLDDKRSFSRKDLSQLDTVNKVNELKGELIKYYLPCKARSYLNDLTEKNVVTILRQCLKCIGYTVNSREKYLKGEKFIIYNLCKCEQRNYVSVIGPVEVTKEKTFITFD